MTSGEVRVVDPKSGGEKGSKLARFSLIPADWLWALAEHYGRGARKYADRNWEKGYLWYLSEDAFMRHYGQWKMGEDVDEETGSHHLICAAWHLIALWWFQKHGKGTDDITTRGIGKPEVVMVLEPHFPPRQKGWFERFADWFAGDAYGNGPSLT